MFKRISLLAFGLVVSATLVGCGKSATNEPATDAQADGVKAEAPATPEPAKADEAKTDAPSTDEQPSEPATESAPAAEQPATDASPASEPATDAAPAADDPKVEDVPETVAQSDELPSSLSLDGIMGEEPAAPEPMKIDPELLKTPENASVDELFAFVEGLQDKLPQPKSQEEMFALVDAISKAYLDAANKILAAADLTDEQRERATQLKVVSLTTRANVDPEAAKELDAFVDENLKAAKTDEELIKAYQLKLQVLAASEEDSLAKIDALADEMYALDKEELQIFALEVKAQSFLTATQKSGAVDKAIFEFADKVVADEARAAKVKEKALEMKLVALVVASELELEKDETDRDASFGEDAEKLFNDLLDGEYSADLRKTVYQLRLQTLFGAQDEAATAKLEDVVKRLLAEEDKELNALGTAVKGQLLLTAAQKDQAAVPALVEYADQTLAAATDAPELKTQAIGLKIQAFRLQDDSEGLAKFVDEQLAAAPDDDLKSKLTQIKLSLIREAVSKDSNKFADYESFLAEVAKDPALESAVGQIVATRFNAKLSEIAEKKGSLDDFNAAFDEFKGVLAQYPAAISAVLMASRSIEQIGENNNNPKLFDESLDALLEFCKKSDVEELNTLGESIGAYVAQKREAEKAAAEAPAAQDATADEPKVEEAAAEVPVDEPKAEEAAAEVPVDEPKAEEAAAEVPVDEPKAEEAAEEAPADEPKAE